jgi:hypothetical protein
MNNFILLSNLLYSTIQKQKNYSDQDIILIDTKLIIIINYQLLE